MPIPTIPDQLRGLADKIEAGAVRCDHAVVLVAEAGGNSSRVFFSDGLPQSEATLLVARQALNDIQTSQAPGVRCVL